MSQTPKTDAVITADKGDSGFIMELAKLSRSLEEENIKLRKALADCREDSIELLGERSWWRDEVRCGYQARYMQTAQNIQIADVLLEGGDNSPISPKTP